LIGLFLALGATVSILQLVNAVHHESGELILWLAWLSITLIFASSLCLFSALYAFLRGRLRRTEPVARKVATNSEYVAQYSRSDRATALVIACSLGLLTAFFSLHSKKPGIIALSATFFGAAVLYAVHTVTTRVMFTHQGFVARFSWFRELREPYDRVQRISGRPGTLKIQFSDGRQLKLHSGMGDPETVIAHLQARCPETVHLE
jgi:hypothetical protein